MKQGKLVREIAYMELQNEDYKSLNIIDVQEEVLTELLQIAECVILDDREVEELHKGVYQDNYYVERYGIQYVIQYDIICDSLTLYELVGGNANEINKTTSN